MTEDYISGYLEAISTVKDILTPNLGGTNNFFRIQKNSSKTLTENVKDYLIESKSWYVKFEGENRFNELLKEIKLEEISNWTKKFESEISNWTCDKELEKINGKNGYYLSEYLINFMLKSFFKEQKVKLYRMLPEWHWHWGDQMSSEFIFETENNIYIMHFGESS